MEQHTPGPKRAVWILLCGGEEVYPESEAKLMTDEQAGASNFLIVEGNPWKWHKAATADESFAAPDLMADLRLIASDACRSIGDARRIARAAIAKAEGN